MEEIKEQTIETSKQNTPKSDKGFNAVIIVLLVLIVVVLGAVVGYQFLKKSGGNVTTTGQTTTTQESTAPQDNTITPGSATQDTGTAPTTVTTVKPDIDGDVKALDKLDLSGVENDYGDSSLSDL